LIGGIKLYSNDPNRLKDSDGYGLNAVNPRAVRKEEELLLYVQMLDVPVVVFNHGGGYATFEINLIAHNPFWQAPTMSVNISEVERKIIYPRVFPEKTSYWNDHGGKTVTGIVNPSHDIKITNIGDAEAGFSLTLTAAYGPVKNPSITKKNTGEKLAFEIDMEKGDKITALSRPQEKDVVLTRLNTEPVSDFTILTDDSDFFYLDIGVNEFFYDAQENILNLDGKLYYNPYYITV
jgi:hypothetical protein